MSDVGEPDHRSIGDVLTLLQAEFVDISISKIRFLESQGLINPERTPSGYRRFYGSDIERLRWILVQQRDHFLPLKVIKDRLDGHETDELLDLTGSTPLVPPSFATHHTAPPTVFDAGVTGSVPVVGLTATPPAAAPRSQSVVTPVVRSAHVKPAPVVVPAAEMPDPVATADLVTIGELCGLTGLSGDEVKHLESYGLLIPKKFGVTMMYDADSVMVAQLAARFYAHGVEARHLRMFKLAVEREMGVFEAASQPQQRNKANGSKRKAVDAMTELATLAEGMHAVLMRKAARQFSDRI